MSEEYTYEPVKDEEKPQPQSQQQQEEKVPELTPSYPAQPPLEPVVEVKPPPEVPEDIFDALNEAFMAKRGLADKRQAAIKLAKALRSIPKPRSYDNLKVYLDSLRNLLDSIPDYPETEPIKGALASQALITGREMVEKSMSKEERLAERIERLIDELVVPIKIIDKVLGPPSQDDALREISRKIEELEKKIEETNNKRTTPEVDKLAKLEKRLSKLYRELKSSRKGGEEDEKIKALKRRIRKVMKMIDKISKAIEQGNKQQAESEDLKRLKEEVSRLRKILVAKKRKEREEKLRREIGKEIGELKDLLSKLAMDMAESKGIKLDEKLKSKVTELIDKKIDEMISSIEAPPREAKATATGEQPTAESGDKISKILGGVAEVIGKIERVIKGFQQGQQYGEQPPPPPEPEVETPRVAPINQASTAKIEEVRPVESIASIQQQASPEHVEEVHVEEATQEAQETTPRMEVEAEQPTVEESTQPEVEEAAQSQPEAQPEATEAKPESEQVEGSEEKT